MRGDLEIAATCTVTYIDAKQLLACGHSILQAGPVSLPMTTADVVATVASPLNAFKIVNTGETIGAFSEDRDSAIRGVFGARARMIPVHIRVHGEASDAKQNLLSARSTSRFWTCLRSLRRPSRWSCFNRCCRPTTARLRRAIT